MQQDLLFFSDMAALVLCCGAICAPVVPLRTLHSYQQVNQSLRLEKMVETLTYHVFHIRRWREHPPPDFVVIIKNGQHVILADVAPFPYFGRGVRAVAVSRAEIGKIERRHCVDTCPQRTSPTRHAQQHGQ